MIIPVLRDITLIHEPDSIDDFIIGAEADITHKDSKGADCFYFRIMSPKGLCRVLSSENILSGRAVFVVNEANMEKNLQLVKDKITGFLLSCARDTWEEVALAINCYLEWEYYDPECGICAFYLDTQKKIEEGIYTPSSLGIEDICTIVNTEETNALATKLPNV
ncbi:MAG: immunity 8 family protein [Firmicutes bacterium]|nr:immunity 8 family protein [Bacillota bacterium]